MTRSRRGVLVLAAVLALMSACALGGVAQARTASAGGNLPVPYSFPAGIALELAHPGGSAPGSNDWTCRPSAAHPRPVILMHGTAGNRQTNWATYAPLLANEGYCVFALTYGALPGTQWPISAVGGLTSVEGSARQFGDFVHRVLAATGARRVDVVGHSLGTMVPDYYAKFLGGADTIDRYVSLAPFWNEGRSTGASGAMDRAAVRQAAQRLGADPPAANDAASLCVSCDETNPGTPFMDKMQAGGFYLPNIHYTNIMTRYDEVVTPYTDGYATGPNATNVVVQDQCAQDFSDHAALAADPVAAADVLNALDPAHPRPVPCVFVPPFVG